MKKLVLKFYPSTQDGSPVAFVNADDKELRQVNPMDYKHCCIVLVDKSLHKDIQISRSGESHKYYCEINEMHKGKGYIVTKILPLPAATATIDANAFPKIGCIKIDVIINFTHFIKKYNIDIFEQNPVYLTKRYQYLVDVFSTMNIIDKEEFLNEYERKFQECMTANKNWRLQKQNMKVQIPK